MVNEVGGENHVGNIQILVVHKLPEMISDKDIYFIDGHSRPEAFGVPSIHDSFSLLLGRQHYLQSASDNSRFKASSAGVSLQIVDVKGKAAVQACATAGLETILIPFTGGKIKEDFIIYKEVPPVLGAKRSIKQKSVTVANRRIRVADELLKAISVRNCKPSDTERLRQRDQWEVYS